MKIFRVHGHRFGDRWQRWKGFCCQLWQSIPALAFEMVRLKFVTVRANRHAHPRDPGTRFAR